VQVGGDPKVAQRFRIEHPREFEVLRLLESERSPAELRRRLVALGGQRERLDQLVRELGAAGLLAPPSRSRSAELGVTPASRELLAPEAETRGLLGDDGWSVLARRANQRVSVYGLGRTGALVALALAVGGVGVLQLHDQRAVRARDRGLVYGPESVGRPRGEALAEVIRERGVGCDVRMRGRPARPDAAVLIGDEVCDPTRSGFLLSHRVGHLPVVVGELGISCGPWVGAGVGPCLRCQRLWAAEEDPCWPGMATQRFVHSGVAKRGEDPTLAQSASALAAAEVFEALAGGRPRTVGRVATIALPGYELEWSELKEHPKCGHHRARPARPASWNPPPILPLPPAQ
jgi:hypothetical protein